MEVTKTKSNKDIKNTRAVVDSEDNRIRKKIQFAVEALQTLSLDLQHSGELIQSNQERAAVQAQKETQLTQLASQTKEMQDKALATRQSFTDAVLQLNSEYQLREKTLEQDYVAKMTAEKATMTTELARLRDELEAQYRQTEALKQDQVVTFNEKQRTWNKDRENLARQLQRLQQELERSRSDAARLKKTIERLKIEAEDSEKIALGRKTEKQVLERRIEEYETFRSWKDEHVKSFQDEICEELRSFCSLCMTKADLAIGWNRVPEAFKIERIPRDLDVRSEDGARIFVATMQHYIVQFMTSHIMVSAPSCVCGEMQSIGNMLYQQKPHLEAAWRCMTAKTLMDEPKMNEGFRQRFENKADALLKSWKIFPTNDMHLLCKRLTDLLCLCLDRWLKLLCTRERLCIMRNGPSMYFMHDSPASPLLPAAQSDMAVKVPGGFQTPHDPDPALCLFPAILVYPEARKSDSERPRLLCKGEAIYDDSRALSQVILAFEKEKQARESTRASQIQQRNPGQ